MRHLFLCTLIFILPILVPAQTRQPRQANVRDWANRVMSKDAKIRTTAQAELVDGAGRSLPTETITQY